MTEEKKQYNKTKELPIEELKKIIDDSYGISMKLSDVKAGFHVVMKILSQVETSSYVHSGTTKLVYKIPCEYHRKGYQPFKVKIQVGAEAVKRLNEKFPANKYVGMFSFFSRTSFENKYPQFVSPFTGEFSNVSKAELFQKIGEQSAEPVAAPVETLPELEVLSNESKVVKKLKTDPKFATWVDYSKKSMQNFLEAIVQLAKRENIEIVTVGKEQALYAEFKEGL